MERSRLGWAARHPRFPDEMTFASKKTCRDRHRLRRLTNSHRNSRNFSRRSESAWTTRDEAEAEVAEG